MRRPPNFTIAILMLLSSCTDAVQPPDAHQAGQIMAASDLANDASRSAAGSLPILLVITRVDCPYCAQIKREILTPMLISGEYENRVVIRELMIEPAYRLVDFSGREVLSDKVAARYEAMFTPTLLLLDARGEELTNRLVGINTTELYGYYLDQAIERALTKLRSDPDR